jgi:pSer/pThr/pTyr-binding forkhead associated (FHA) protein
MAEFDEKSQSETGATQPIDPAKEALHGFRMQPNGEPSLRVEVVGGPMDGLRKTVAGSVLTLGRDEASDLTLPLDVSVSTRHARIVREKDHFWLEDLESRNGTFLGDKRIRKRALIGSGTHFTVGRTILEFSVR